MQGVPSLKNKNFPPRNPQINQSPISPSPSPTRTPHSLFIPSNNKPNPKRNQKIAYPQNPQSPSQSNARNQSPDNRCENKTPKSCTRHDYSESQTAVG